ncbi:hypothetical protein CDEST_06225 [Colletotrichum destructivum]|uniref:Uncharacterized protein n=1 Tax=Colletotrichum destructivum TaxID=34406 RepID=A0AAX4IDJ3_9PEZI|nr:hypothetical protein CDEST_06225 [Colletotrichum destructivum]
MEGLRGLLPLSNGYLRRRGDSLPLILVEAVLHRHTLQTPNSHHIYIKQRLQIEP